MDIELRNMRVVAVDGGVATGKSRLIEELAAILRRKGVPVVHVSSGHLYRAIAWVALQRVQVEILGGQYREQTGTIKEAVQLVCQMKEESLLDLARQHDIAMHLGMAWIDNAPAGVDEQLKAPGVGLAVSHVASFLPVREYVNAVIRRQINEFDGYVLIDGRDIGSQVVPDAPLRLLLTVSPEVAANRSPEHTIEEIVARNEADHDHVHGALPRPHEVHESVMVLGTDDHTPESIRDHVYALMREVFPELPDLD